MSTTAGGEKLVVTSTLSAEEKEILDRAYRFSDGISAAAKDDVAKFEEDFGLIVKDATTSLRNVKLLAVQLIPKHSVSFPKFQAAAVTAVIALCTDEDPLVRSHALKGLANVAKDVAGGATAIANNVSLATEMLVSAVRKHTEDAKELSSLYSAFDKIVAVDVKAVFGKLLSYLEAGEGDENDALREVTCRLFQERVIVQSKVLICPFPDTEELLKEKIQQVLECASEDEFKMLIGVLSGLRIFSAGNKHGPQGLADIIAAQAVLEAPVEPSAEDELQRVLECVNIAMPFFKAGALDNTLAPSLVKNVLMSFGTLPLPSQTLTLHRICELVPHVSPAAAAQCVAPVFELLMAQLPVPTAPAAAPADTDAVAAAAILPEINFSVVEGLLFILHQCGRKNPAELVKVCGILLEGIASDLANSTTFAAFKEKILFCHETSQNVLTKLKQVSDKLKTSNKMQRLTLERGMLSIRNIVDMFRPLTSGKPYCLAALPSAQFSWQAVIQKEVVGGIKRPLVIDDASKKAKVAKPSPQTYVPISRRALA